MVSRTTGVSPCRWSSPVSGVFGSALRRRSPRVVCRSRRRSSSTGAARHRRLADAQQHDQRDPAGDGHRAPVDAAAQRQRARRPARDPHPLRARDDADRSRSAPARRRPVSFRMLRRTSAGSLYGSVEAFGKPTNTKGRKGIIPQYRLICSLRLNPSRKKSHKLKTGAAQVRCGAAGPAGPQPRQHDRPGQRHLHALRRRARARARSPAVTRHPRQARRPQPRRHARDEEGPLHRHRLARPGRQARSTRTNQRHGPLIG